MSYITSVKKDIDQLFSSEICENVNKFISITTDIESFSFANFDTTEAKSILLGNDC